MNVTRDSASPTQARRTAELHRLGGYHNILSRDFIVEPGYSHASSTSDSGIQIGNVVIER